MFFVDSRFDFSDLPPPQKTTEHDTKAYESLRRSGICNAARALSLCLEQRFFLRLRVHPNERLRNEQMTAFRKRSIGKASRSGGRSITKRHISRFGKPRAAFALDTNDPPCHIIVNETRLCRKVYLLFTGFQYIDFVVYLKILDLHCISRRSRMVAMWLSGIYILYTKYYKLYMNAARDGTECRSSTSFSMIQRSGRNHGYSILMTRVIHRLIEVTDNKMPVLSTCPLHTNSGCGKERRTLIGPW